jgi:trehalose 6-phosphate phosphatase
LGRPRHPDKAVFFVALKWSTLDGCGLMVHILAKRHLHKLAEFASSNVLLAFDYDGTLAPIVADPSVARMRPGTRRLLAAVARRYPCVVISGRSRRDVIRRVGSIPIWHVSGNHGLEPWAQDDGYRSKVRRWVRRLERDLAAYPGVVVEDKTYSVTVHYRNALQKRRAARAVDEAAGRLPDARLLGGKDAVSVIPRGAANKGTALDRTRRLLVCDTAIYLGDDVTDEDAFKAGAPDRLLGIRVSPSTRSRAGYYLRNQHEVDQLLRTLVALRPVRHARSPRL